ncbi:hypothetical protein N7467_008592 [Penicillium canescens]|nr:hypothetical protein N7467_008592 [Penicillium canescens]
MPGTPTKSGIALAGSCSNFQKFLARPSATNHPNLSPIRQPQGTEAGGRPWVPGRAPPLLLISRSGQPDPADCGRVGVGVVGGIPSLCIVFGSYCSGTIIQEEFLADEVQVLLINSLLRAASWALSVEAVKLPNSASA